MQSVPGGVAVDWCKASMGRLSSVVFMTAWGFPHHFWFKYKLTKI